MTARRSPKRKEEVLAAASSVMRTRGLPGTRLKDVARSLGIAHSALYHYFENREHMAQEVLVWNLGLRSEHLAVAEGDSALERLLDFIGRDLEERRKQKIRIPSLVSLPERFRQPVEVAREQFTCELAKLIGDGMADGSIRRCDAKTIAHIISHTVEAFVLVEKNASTRLRRSSGRTLASHVTDLVRRGIAQGRTLKFEPSWSLADGKDLIVSDTSVDEEIERLEQLKRTATRHFNARGAEASVSAMAEELGISKGVIYQYTQDKRELMFQCLERAVGVMQRSNWLASHHGQDPLDEILIHRNNLFLYHASDVGPFTNVGGIDYLKPHHQRLIKMQNRAVRQISARRVERGIAEGQLRREIDPDFVQPMLWQALYGLPGWFDDEYPLSIKSVSRQALMLHLQGLASLK